MPLQRAIKNIVNNYSDVERKVREATSNDPWGPASHLMSELSDLSYNVMAFTELMQMLWKRLNEKQQRNWRHIFKALLVLEYIIKTGSERVAIQCKDNIHCIETLMDFQLIEDGRDFGQNIRSKSKDVVTLLRDPTLLSSERVKALKAKERLSEQISIAGNTGNGLSTPKRYPDIRRAFDRRGPASQSMRMDRSDTYIQNHPENDSTTASMTTVGGGVGGGIGGNQYHHHLATASSSSTTNSRIIQVTERKLSNVLLPDSEEAEQFQLQLALALSREEHEIEKRRKEEEEEQLKKALHHSRNETSLSDKSPSSLNIQAQKNKRNNTQISMPSSTGGSVDANGSSLLDLIDVSLSAAPANAPDPWGSVINSPFSSTKTPPTASSSIISPARQPPMELFAPPPYSEIATTTSTSSSTAIWSLQSNESVAMTDVNNISTSTLNGDGQEINATTSVSPEHAFLGEHSGLVNLNELVTRTNKSSLNPFSICSTVNHSNPFAPQQPNSQTLNELAKQQSSNSPISHENSSIISSTPSSSSVAHYINNPWFPPTNAVSTTTAAHHSNPFL